MKLKRLKQLYRDGDVPLRGVPAVGNPVLGEREAFKLKHGVYSYDGKEPPWEVEDDSKKGNT